LRFAFCACLRAIQLGSPVAACLVRELEPLPKRLHRLVALSVELEGREGEIADGASNRIAARADGIDRLATSLKTRPQLVKLRGRAFRSSQAKYVVFATGLPLTDPASTEE
jgi:hypothetical protein